MTDLRTRSVVPEILDQLSADDPEAIRSRRDLRMINFFMRGHAWILDQIATFKNLETVVELGAGDGLLIRSISEKFPGLETVAVDLIDRPASLPRKIRWEQCDVTDFALPAKPSLVVANLFLHHLSDEQLNRLGKKFSAAHGWLIAEPLRTRTSLLMARTTFPLVNRVTRHDMMVSIRAGFQGNELPRLLGDATWEWKLHQSLCGGIRYRGATKTRDP